MGWRKVIFRLVAVILPLLAGGALLTLSMAQKKPPIAKQREENAVAVRVLTLKNMALVPRVVGYGTVKPAREWRAVARVEGEVSWTSDNLANGLVVVAGTELLRIDDSDIRLSLAQFDAQLTSLDVKDETARASQKISEETLALARKELARLRTLATGSVISKSAVEQVERQEITARAAVVSLTNQIAVNSAEREVLNAQRDIAARSLTHTSIRAPYAVRIGTVQAEIGQFTNRGQQLFSADGVDVAEISAQFPIGRLAPLIAGTDAQINVRGAIELKAVVRLRALGRLVEWPARLDRIGETIDPKTQSVTVVINVDQPLALAKPGERPPLWRNMFVEVELRAVERMALVVPLNAIRSGKAMLLDKNNRLELRAVSIAFATDGIAVVSSGLSAGERLIVSDLALPISGSLLTAVEDEKLQAELATTAGSSR